MQFHRSPITYVSQADLKVSHLQRALVFYQQVLGFKVLNQTERGAELSADGQRTLLKIEKPTDVVPKQKGTTGLYHVALLLPSRSDLAAIVRHFDRLGVPYGSSDHLVSEALYLSDPDGNGIEVYADRDPSAWHWTGDSVQMSVDPLDFSDLLSRDDREWEGMPSETVVGHIHLHVSHLDDATAFYVRGLGFQQVSRLGGQAVFLSDGRYHHHIGLNTWQGIGAPPPAPNSTGLHSFTVLFPTEEKRDKAVVRLKAMGASLLEEDGAILTIDPSGNRIRLASAQS